MHQMRTRLGEASIHVSQLEANSNLFDISKRPTEEEVKIGALMYNEACENYLNTIDRLCSVILKEIIPPIDAKKDYRQMIIDTVCVHNNYLGTGTRFRNIIKVHDRWADEG